RAALIHRYQMLGRAASPGEPAYELAAQRMRAEDEAWALGRDLRSTDDEARKQELRNQLEQVVRQMVDSHLEERQTRIDHLKREVAAGDRRLARDTSRRDELVEQQMLQIIEDEQHLLRPPGERGERSRGEADEPAPEAGLDTPPPPREGRGPRDGRGLREERGPRDERTPRDERGPRDGR